MEELPDVPVITNAGFQGCAHARPGGKRQILLVDRNALEAMNLQPGIIRENIMTEGLNVNGLKTGEQLQIGDVRLAVSAICTPCGQLEKVRPGLRKELWGRRGMLCRVVSGGSCVAAMRSKEVRRQFPLVETSDRLVRGADSPLWLFAK